MVLQADTLGLLGSIASLIALVVMAFQLIRGWRNKIIDKQEEHKRLCENLKEEVNFLASKATNHQRRMEIYMFANSTISYARHQELAYRIVNVFLHVISFIAYIICVDLSS
ncbi:hypothetical protein QKW35_10180 [Pontibacterium granulatum]|uniref:hypothetical protein n=1 Tax=Pontibacterium granulatum TaxID=2036029 RepID=UPI002499E1DA|nr:hypothetical protein [Pontibacterium granulatum]MDI3324743.1 hypothetical protein [Pontibacterium granulatum]